MYNNSVIYVCDGSFEGILSAVHCAYYSHENPERIMCGDDCQQQLFCETKVIETDLEKARRVQNAISEKISPNALFNVYRVHLSDEKNRATMIFNYLKIGFNIGAKVDMYLSDKWVSMIHGTARRVSREACRMREFVRFAEMENGVLFAQIEPDNNVLEMICSHFADRLRSLPWVICDTRRSIAAIYDTKRWEIVRFDEKNRIDMCEDEEKYQRMWKRFYDIIGIESRRNDRQRMQCMPKKYWKNMTEFKGA